MITISVVIPVKNEEQSIRQLLARLLDQTRRPQEIVITDGGSTDATTQIIDEFISAGAPIKLIRVEHALPGHGRNLAASVATSNWLAFIDGGIEPAGNWIELLAATAERDPDVDVVYGGWEPVIDSFFTECASITYFPPPTPINQIVTRPCCIASSLMKKSVWHSVGGFPETLRSAEDLLFMNAIESAGFKSVFEPTAVVRWHLRPSFSSTFKRFVVYSRNNIRAGLSKQWQAAIATRYILLLLVAILVIAINPAWFWLPVALWLLMLAARAVVAIRRNRNCYPATPGRNLRRLFVLVPLIGTIDLAAIFGTVQWLFLDWFPGIGKVTVEANGT